MLRMYTKITIFSSGTFQFWFSAEKMIWFVFTFFTLEKNSGWIIPLESPGLRITLLAERKNLKVKGASVQKTELTCYICYILLTSFSSSSFSSQPIPSVLDYHTTLQNINTTYIPWIHTYPTEHKDHIYPGYIYSGLVWSGKEFHFWIWS